jgi:hypothetical protein
MFDSIEKIIFNISFIILVFQTDNFDSSDIKSPKLILSIENALQYKQQYDKGYNFSYINVKVYETLHLNCIGDKDMDWMFQDFHPVRNHRI